ncbi:hypothetical protein LCGC14_1891860 [marine sediment metagenome]|uniref:Uncharacterized protein n=1 Tax=marine sediment metagenome TaxID=412755 RepID=A0A0F9FZ76_9ZZZZ
MSESTLTHGKYTIDIERDGCAIYVIEEDQKIFLCGGIADPELAMSIVEGLILVEAKKFYHPEATRAVTMADGETVPHFLKKD